MPIISKGYPNKLKTEDLKNLIAEYQQEILDKKGHINTVMQFSPLVQLGLNELQERSARKVRYLSLLLSILALVVAGASLYVATVTA